MNSLQSQNRTLTTISPKQRFDKLVLDLLTGKKIDGSDILVILQLLKSKENRRAFVDSLHGKAPGRLTMSSFILLTDLMRVLLREANNSEDFSTIFIAYSILNLYSTKTSGIHISAKSVVRFHEVWLNVDFWLYCTEELIQQDVGTWSSRYSSLSFDLLAMDEPQVYGILAINRIQAVVTSMHSVGITETVRKEYLLVVADHFGLVDSGINVIQAPTERFIAWLLDIALVHKEEQRPNRTVTVEAPSQVVDHRHKSANLGFCPLLEMLFCVANKLLGAPPSRKMSVYDDMLCICGRPNGGWQPLGIFEKRFSHRENLPSILCEHCYRHILANPLDCDGVFAETKRCVVPMTEPEPPTSFLAVFYGHGTAEQRRTDAHIDFSRFSLAKEKQIVQCRKRRQREVLRVNSTSNDSISSRSAQINSSVSMSASSELSYQGKVADQNRQTDKDKARNIGRSGSSGGPTVPPSPAKEVISAGIVSTIGTASSLPAGINKQLREDYAHSDTSQSSTTDGGLHSNGGSGGGGHSRNSSGDHSWLAGFTASASDYVIPQSGSFNNGSVIGTSLKYQKSASDKYIHSSTISSTTSLSSAISSQQHHHLTQGHSGHGGHGHGAKRTSSVGDLPTDRAPVGGIAIASGGDNSKGHTGIGSTSTGSSSAHKSSASAPAPSSANSSGHGPTSALAGVTAARSSTSSSLPLVPSSSHGPRESRPVAVLGAGEIDRDREDLSKFVNLLWGGLEVTKMGWSALSRQRPRVLFLDRSVERLCWQPPGRPDRVPDDHHSVLISTIRQIRVGSGRWDRCVSLVFSSKTLVLKVEDQKTFKTLVDGLILLTDSYRKGEPEEKT